MKILYICDGFPPAVAGGAGTVAQQLAQAMVARGHEVYILTTINDPTQAGIQVIDRMTIKRVCISNTGLLRFWRGLYHRSAVRIASQYIAVVQPDIVHAHTLNGIWSWWVLFAGRTYTKRIFMTMHDTASFAYSRIMYLADHSGFMPAAPPDYRMTFLRRLRQARWKFVPFREIIIWLILWRVGAVIIAVSDAVREALRQNGIRATVRIYNGVDMKAAVVHASAVTAFRRAHNLIDHPVILFGGRIMGSKGIDQLFAVLPFVIARVPKAILVIIGDINEQFISSVDVWARKHELKENIVLLPWQRGADYWTALAVADVVVMPSLCFETMGMMAAEAAALVKPVIAGCYGGTIEVVAEGVTGYVLNPYNTALFARRLTVILSDHALAHRLGKAGQRRIQKLFTLEAQVATTERLYNGEHLE